MIDRRSPDVSVHPLMKNVISAAVVAIALSLVACKKAPTTGGPPGAQPQAQAQPYKGGVYKSGDGNTVLTLVSSEECEIQANGTTLLCKYTKQADTLRVVLTALGTSQVLYFR